MTRLILSATIACATAATTARGQCEGNGSRLDLPTTLTIGEAFTGSMHVPTPEADVLLLVSLGDGPTNGGSYGTLCVDFPPFAAMFFRTDANGDASFCDDVPCDPTLIGLVFYSQFITCKPGSGKRSHGSSNMVETTVVDGLGENAFCTWTQESWGADCADSSIACLLEQEFDDLYSEFLIGDPDGRDDGDGVWAATWTNAKKLGEFLPIYGTAGVLTSDQKDPKTLPACVFAGELAAAQLNLDFDDAGLFDDSKCRTDLKLGELVFIQGVCPELIGMTVRDVIALSNLAIGCAFGPGPIDVDGDGDLDCSMTDLSNALNALNRNFEDCTNNLGYLGLP